MNDKKALHFKYCIGILIGLIVIITAAAWGADPKLADRINFAVGVTSVILALLAIYVTINFNSLFSNHVTTFLGLNQRIEESAGKLLHATNELSTKLDQVPSGIQGLAKKFDFVAEKFLAQPERTSLQVSDDKSGDNKKHIEWTERNLSAVFLDLQFSGMLCIYLAVKTDFTGKQVATSDLRAIKAIDPNYFIGITAAFKAVSLWNYKIVKDIHVLSSVNDILTDNIEKWLNSVIEIYKKDSTAVDTSNYLQKGKAEIDAFIQGKIPVQPEAKPATPNSPTAV